MNACMRSSTCWVFLALISLFLFVAACGTAGSALETLAPSPRPPGTPIPATSTSTVEIPTPTPTPTEAMALAPHRPDLAAGAYSAEQGRQIEAGAFASQEQVLAAYYQYWAGAAYSPVHPPAAEDGLFFIYVFNLEDSADACLAIAATGYFNFEVLSAPYVQGRPQTVPPEQYVNGRIETGQSPLLLNNSGISTETGEQFQLNCQAGRWVRRDAAGAVMERINQQNQWEVDAGWLAARHNLNPAHQYSIVTVTNEDGTDARYLRDEHNQAYMRMYQAPQPGENPAEVERWVDTSLEEKYGHLVPPDARSFVDLGHSNYYASDVELHGNPEFVVTMTAAWSTGNSRYEPVYYPILGRDMFHITTLMVYRDQSGNLQPLNTIEIVDPLSTRLPLFGCADAASGFDATSATMCDGEWMGFVDSVETLVNVYSLPGLHMDVRFDTIKPDAPPPDTAWSMEIAHYMLWLEYRQSSQALSDSLMRGTGINPYPEVPVVVSRFNPYLPWEQYSSYITSFTP